ncbi:MAG: large repetitive protein, partial [Blastocatellia bacterium]|nr:large repetitive protein [Blastocatellia bacterium]
MTQLSPSRPIHRLRVFSACLLSLLMIAAPMTPLAASAHSTATASSEKQAERKLANLAKKQLSPGEALDRSYVVGAPPAAAVTATLSDSFVDTAPADGMADPGSIVTYTATITNSTGADITGVNFTDTISPYTTLILGSIKISPRAIADSYNATQNTVLDTAASSLPTVLANDTGTPAPTVSGVVGCADVTAPFTCNTTQAGGSVTLNTNGSFTYTPPSGFTGTDDFTYNATNGISPDDTAKVTINVTPPCPTITVTNPATTSGPAGTPFSQTFTQTGGVGTTNFTLNSGTLPTGLTLHSGTGVLDGTPTQGGTFPITVKATDSNACTGIGPTYNLTITCQTITVTNPGVNTGTVNAAFSQTFTQSGGIGTITWSETGALPTGITLNTSTGVLSGTPTQSGSFPITVTATDGNGCTGTGSTYTLTINCQTITVTKPVTATGTVDTAFSQNFTQTGAQ